jgi:phage terminase large subunit-like protein
VAYSELGKARAERVIRFIEKYILVPEGILIGKPMVLLPEQKDFIYAVYGNVDAQGMLITRRGVFSIARKNGKGLALDTPIPTPHGWRRMGDLAVGDELFDEEGKICNVEYVSPVHIGLKCWRLAFSDGTHIVADEQHRWLTTAQKSRRAGPKVVTTPEIAASVLVNRRDGSVSGFNHGIQVAGALRTDPVELEVDPYLLGCWLGDGYTRNANLSCGDEDVDHFRRAVGDGLQCEPAMRREKTAWSITMSGGRGGVMADKFQAKLRDIGVLGNKHIPAKYLWAGTEQRLALLQGLMDTDGTISPTGKSGAMACNFGNMNERLTDGVLLLVRSLGMKATKRKRVAKLYDREFGHSYQVQFTAWRDNAVFRLPRKFNKLKPRPAISTRSATLKIVACDPVESVPTRCIKVSSKSSLFLAGEGMTPTHNTGLVSALLAAHLIGPEAKENSMVYSAARSRDQAALVFNYLAKSLRLRDDLQGLVEITDSGKKIKGLAMGTEYRALSADATTAHGLSPALTIHDELGQVRGPSDPLYDALETAGGAQLEPLSLIISTQAANDADLLSTIIDDAIRTPTPENVVRLYAAGKDEDVFDKKVWYRTNFALDKFRSFKDFEETAKRAKRMSAFESTFRNLYLNQRVSLLNLFVPPSVWKENGLLEYDDSVFFDGNEVHVGIDLSSVRDLTSVVLSARDVENRVHLKCFTFTPQQGLEDRVLRDKAPYDAWVRSGHVVAVPGRTIDYSIVAEFLAENTQGMNIVGIHFDRWRMEQFKRSADEAGFPESTDAQWLPVGQGFRDMSPRIEYFETLLLNNMVAHGENPVLTYAASNAIIVSDPAMNRKLDKSKSSARIDPMVAAVMSAYGFAENLEEAKKELEVTDDSLFFV